MKKIKKHITFILILFLAICQISINVNAYPKDEVVNIIDYKTVEENGEPDSYDVLVELDDFEKDERVPCLRTSIETVLYGKNKLFNINFFDKSKTTNDEGIERWNKIRNIVVTVFQISTYIAYALTLTVLIYITLILATQGLTDKNILPMSSNILQKLTNKKNNPKSRTIEKKLIEQWIITVAMVAFVPFALSAIYYFSNSMINMIYDPPVSEDSDVETNYITVYAKYRVKPKKTSSTTSSSTSTLGSNNSSTNSSNNTSGTATSAESAKQMRQAVVDFAASFNNLGVPGGYCEMWVERVYNTVLGRSIPLQCCAHHGGQAANATQSVAIVPGAAVFSYKSSGGVMCSGCGQDAGHVGIYIGDGKIASCTGGGTNGVSIHTIEEWQQSWLYSGWGWLPGTEDLAVGAEADDLSARVTASNVGSAQVSDQKEEVDDTEYYFKTNLEGLLLYQTQYKGNVSKIKDRVPGALIFGMILTIFKYFLYIIFFIGMIIMGTITAISPILALIHGIMKLTSGRGILQKVFIIYLYVSFLRPIVGILYHIFVIDHFVYNNNIIWRIGVAIAVTISYIVGSIMYLLKSLEIKDIGAAIKKKVQKLKAMAFRI